MRRRLPGCCDAEPARLHDRQSGRSTVGVDTSSSTGLRAALFQARLTSSPSRSSFHPAMTYGMLYLRVIPTLCSKAKALPGRLVVELTSEGTEVTPCL